MIISMMDQVSLLNSGLEYRLNYRFAVDKLGYDHQRAQQFALQAAEEQRQLDIENMKIVSRMRMARERQEMMARYLARKSVTASTPPPGADAEANMMNELIDKLASVTV